MVDTDEGYAKSIDEIWRLFDENQNGKLEKDEAKVFLRAILKQVNGSTPTNKEIKRNFVKMDLDRSGDIDKEEALKYLKGMRIGL